MKRNYANQLFILSFICCVFLTTAVGAQEYYTVKWVDDGDTILLTNGWRIRYIGINAPEVKHKENPSEPFGNEARDYNKLLLKTKQVWFEYDKEKTDHYDRKLAYVFLADGTLINAEMIKKGYAYYLPTSKNRKYSELLFQKQQDAMRQGRGIWQNLDKYDTTPYIGNKQSKRFHDINCPFSQKIQKSNKVKLKGKWNAFWEGYAPCKKCIH